MRSVLIVGGDSLIGRALYQAYKIQSVQVFATSKKGTSESIYLDLSQSFESNSLPKCEVVYLCAAISRFIACEQNPGLALRVNVAAQLELARHFLSLGAHVVFLSSNAVFDGTEEAPNENACLSPTSLYGQLKAKAEKELESIAKRYQSDLSIVRLSKVLSHRSPLIADWLSDLREGRIITAFSDITLSPISLDYAVNGLIACGKKNIQGKFHLSGQIELTYQAFAKMLASGIGLDQRIVSVKSNDRILTHNRLGMASTEVALGIKAQDVNSLLADILKNH